LRARRAVEASITETDLFPFTWIGDPQVSPDGTRLVFMRALEQDDNRVPPQLYLLSMRGGEPAALTDLPKGTASQKWSPDGTRIAFKSETAPRDLQPREAREPRECPAENAPNGCLDATRESDMRTITRAVYRSNDDGYLDPTSPAHIWVAEASAPPPDTRTAKQITQGAWEDNEFVWSIDGRQIYFTKSHLHESCYVTAAGSRASSTRSCRRSSRSWRGSISRPRRARSTGRRWS